MCFPLQFYTPQSIAALLRPVLRNSLVAISYRGLVTFGFQLLRDYVSDVALQGCEKPKKEHISKQIYIYIYTYIYMYTHIYVYTYMYTICAMVFGDLTSSWFYNWTVLGDIGNYFGVYLAGGQGPSTHLQGICLPKTI